MCYKVPDQRHDDGNGRAGRGGPSRDRRFSALALGLTVLACGPKRPGGREEDDPMHDALKEEGTALRKLLGLDDDGNGKGRRHRFAAFAGDARRIMTGPDQGGRYLARRDLTGWARYVFLDDSPERHPFNCRYVRMLRAVRGVGRIGGVA